MQNTECCHFSDFDNKVKDVCILGRTVPVKNYICSPDGVNYRLKTDPVRLQLTLLPLSFCPASCPFCLATDTGKHLRIDTAKLEKTMKLLKAEDRVRGIKITGGEPFYDIDLLNEVINILFSVFGESMEVSVSTNGIGLGDLDKLDNLELLESIHISRHHYDDDVNRSLFGGFQVPGAKELKAAIDPVPFKDIFVFNCMLLKGYIDSKEEAHRFLDFAIETGVPKVGFMVCTPVNRFAESHTLPFESVIRDDDDSILFTRGFYDHEYCHCRDGVYVSPDGRLIELYGRDTAGCGVPYSRGLVYDYDGHLKDGFGGNIII